MLTVRDKVKLCISIGVTFLNLDLLIASDLLNSLCQ